MIFRNEGLPIRLPKLILLCEVRGFVVKSMLIDPIFFGHSYLSMNKRKRKNSFLNIYLVSSERGPENRKDKQIGLKCKLHLFR